MDILRQYIIHWKGLSNGSHHFEFEVDDRLFGAFESPDIKSGNAGVQIDMQKSDTLLLLDITIEGEVTVECDRCLEDLNVPIDFEGELKVKFSEEEQESDGEVMWINPGDGDLSLGQYVYESIVLSLPYSRVHEDDEDGNTLCNEEMVARFRIVTSDEFEELETAAETSSLADGDTGDKLRELKEKLEKDNK